MSGKDKDKIYEAAMELCEKKLTDKEFIKAYTEGYKIGFRDGYLAAMKDIVPQVAKQIEEGAEPGWILPKFP